MKEISDTKCEPYKTIDLRLGNRLNYLFEDDINLKSGTKNTECIKRTLGGIFHEGNYAWLSSKTRLIVLNVKTTELISFWNFSEKIVHVVPFPTLSEQIPLLLVGLSNEANRIKDSFGLLCIFDCTVSRVLRAIRMPAGVEQMCILHGGAHWEECNKKRINSVLKNPSGIAYVALCNFQHLIIDLRRNTWETSVIVAVSDELNPADIDFLNSNTKLSSRHQFGRERHAAYDLMNKEIEKFIGFNRDEFESLPLTEEKLTTASITSWKIDCLILGCLGRVIIWQYDGTVRWISQVLDEQAPISHLALLEPTDDPKPFYYLWVVCQEESMPASPILRMYAMFFERKSYENGTNLYTNLECEPSFKFELELDDYCRVISLVPIERDNNVNEPINSLERRVEESLLLIGTEDRMLMFDLNQWYKEHMPHSLAECPNPNTMIARYQMRNIDNSTLSSLSTLISYAYVPLSLTKFPRNGLNSRDELFYPNSLSLTWLELQTNQLTFWKTRGVQAELLREITSAGSIILQQPTEAFHRCLSVGLKPFNTECSFNSEINIQIETLLSVCLEQHLSTFLIKCAREWSDGSASYLFPLFLKWAAQRAARIKLTADELCIPLFDHSGINIGEAEVKTLRFCCKQLECLSNILSKLPVESVNLKKQQRALKRISTYFDVLLWFHEVGILPETDEFNEDSLQVSSFSMNIKRLKEQYQEKRDQAKKIQNYENNETVVECLFIDELIASEFPSLREQWERECASADSSYNGYYPPPSLQSMLRTYLTDLLNDAYISDEMTIKHQITTYLLMDFAMLLQNSYPNIVKQLIEYPSAFKLSPTVIKLTQAFWLLDHKDYQGFLDMMMEQLVLDSDIKEWHHKLIIKTLLLNDQHKLALNYLHIRKPPLSSLKDQETLINLTVKHGLVNTAFHYRPPSHYSELLESFYEACKSYGKLSEILYLTLSAEEEEALVKFLEHNDCDEFRTLYYLQRGRHVEKKKQVTHLQQNECVQMTSLKMINAYYTTLPEVVRRFKCCSEKKGYELEDASRSPKPLSHRINRNKTRDIHEMLMKKSRETHVSNDRNYVPFISAPCSSLKINSCTSNIDFYRVIYPQKKEIGKKRRLEEMVGNEKVEEEVSKSKKCKTTDAKKSMTPTTIDGGLEMSISAISSTPLVGKKKTPFISTRNGGIEGTPQSILKIRQMIRNSTSPPPAFEGRHSSLSRERPFRQLRFSLARQRDSWEMNEHAEEHGMNRYSLTKNYNKKNREEESNKMREDANNDDEENKEENHKEEEMEKVAFMNETCADDVSSSARSEHVLSANSSYDFSFGPRARPSLRSNSQLHSSYKSDSSKSTSLRTSSEYCGVNISAGSPNSTKQMSKTATPSRTVHKMSMTSMYATSVLSSDTSIEISRREYTRNSSNASGESSITSVESESKHTNSIMEEYITKEQNDVEEMEVENTKIQTTDRQHQGTRLNETDRTYKSVSENINIKTRKTAISSQTSAQESSLNDKKGNRLSLASSKQKDSQNIDNFKNMDLVSRTEKNVELEHNEHEETFHSLEDSSHPADAEEKLNSKQSDLSKCHEFANDFNITDDESTNSFDGAAHVPKVSINVATIKESNVHDFDLTDDESNDGFVQNTNISQQIHESIKQKKGENKRERSCNLIKDLTRESYLNVATNNEVELETGEQCIHESEDIKLAVSEEETNDFSVSTVVEELQRNEKIITKEKPNVEPIPKNIKRKITRSRSQVPETGKEEVESSGRVTRSRRAQSVTHDIVPEFQSSSVERTKRLRRSTSLLKDMLLPSTDKVNVEPMSSASAAQKDIDLEQDSNLIPKKKGTKSPVRTRLKRATFLQKDIFMEAESNTTSGRGNTVTSSIATPSTDITANEENELSKNTVSRGRRKTSITEDSDILPKERSTRASSVSKKITIDPQEVKTPKGRRHNSVPRETTSASLRSRRQNISGNNLTSEDLEANQDTRKHSVIMDKIVEEISSSPATNTRARRSSIQSIPIEMEEILNVPSDGRNSKVGRNRRATSVDTISAEQPRRLTRSAVAKGLLKQKSILEEPVLEEFVATNKKKSTKKSNATSSRKRITSESSSMREKDDQTEIVEKMSQQKGEKGKEHVFSFSLPDQSEQVPVVKAEDSQTPSYMFSLPQIKSKQAKHYCKY